MTRQNQPLQAADYFKIWTTLFRDAPGPVAVVWGGCAIVQFAIIARMTGAPIEGFGLFIGLLLGLFVVGGLQKALYAPLRGLAASPQRDPTLPGVLATIFKRLGIVLLVQFLIGVLFSAIALIFVALGAPLFGVFVVLQMFWFMLAPAVYFAAAHRMAAFTAIGRALAVARDHLLWIVGIPALFWCVGALVDQYICAFEELAAGVLAGDVVMLLRALFLYVLYRYLQWISVAAVYVAVDAEEDG